MLIQQASTLKDEILKLKKEKNVVILAHNYQIPDVQDVADFTGDSLGLSRQAAKVEQKTILFCGVTFMAETAAIISPEKKVLIPDLEAGCSLSDSITVDELQNWKKQHPDAIVVGYVNTTAEIKAELDYCCTSSNAVNVVNAIPEDKEHPASKFGSNTFFSGLLIAAVSAIKVTPQNRIVFCSTFAACLERPRESPVKSATSCTSGIW